MSKAIMILADGFEETEALATADILRRGGIELCVAALSGYGLSVKGAHGVTVTADAPFEDALEDYDAIILPGGPGTENYFASRKLMSSIKSYFDAGKIVAAICAAPSALAAAGVLRGKKAVCYPGYEKKLDGAEFVDAPVVTDGNVVTSKGPGTAVNFGLKLVELLEGGETAKITAEKFIAQL